ncbi:snoRNA-binding rRNA-processing protein NOP14 [Aspergillus undulatus]|uniref:snoRNA-binding rRNA-processing protein NOP14 n=1 Tax=Aspergillus undulatus TaxID=1810928 RepID=UPI003CCDCF10
MPPSQLKQLKASLRDTGVLGPQKSKKQKRQNAKTGGNAQNRAQRESALEAIRERFNPFEIRTVSRNKFDVTTRDGDKSTTGRYRPGVTKSLGEERRRQTLLQEMDRKNKVGGIMDRRFGENDPTMTPEERAAERFARASQKKLRKDSMFNLEEDDEEEFTLTHKGESLSFGDGADDFNEDVEADDMSDSEMPRKRKRFLDDDGEIVEPGSQDEEEVPERKKSKHEVMQEVIAKSKFHKAQRQQAKEDDDDLREELDKGLPDLFDMLRGVKPHPKPEPPKDDLAGMNPDRAAILQGQSQGDMEKEYDQRLKQLTFDKRSMPTDRTKTEEEKAEEEAQRLKKLEEERLRRMRGESVSEDEAVGEGDEEDAESSDEDESLPDDAKDFGLQQPTNYSTSRPAGVDDEDDFILDDLVETRSDVSLDDEYMSGSEEEEPGESSEEESEQEDEHINGLTMPGDKADAAAASEAPDDKLAYTYPCPSTHEEFLQTVKDVSYQDLPTIIQRTRALHHPRLHSENKAKLGRFASILVQHAAYMAEQPEHPPFAIVENVLRHIHSLTKSYPESVSLEFRAQLREIATERPLALKPRDLVILTGIATIFPTSDHFHAISTPAHLCLARYLGQGPVNTLSDLCTGTYAASLAVQYQTVSKRYMPEFLNYVLNALCILSPEEPSSSLGSFPLRSPSEPLRFEPSKSLNTRKLQFWDIIKTQEQPEELKLALITTLITLLNTALGLWSTKSASTEIFEQAQAVLTHLLASCTNKKNKKVFLPSSTLKPLTSTLESLSTHLSNSRLARRPLLLHNHKPLAVKQAIPKFEETFNPDKHYDPNRERAELNKLKAEYKRERKGAMRELRKDANFVAREKLREKKEKDAEYEKKYRRLVAEVQNEEGREANAYEREKRMRQGKR